MAQTSINIRMDNELKNDFDSFCEKVGMSMTTAFCIFAKTVVREQRIPFEITTGADPFFSEANMARLARAVRELDAGHGTPHELIEVPDDE